MGVGVVSSAGRAKKYGYHGPQRKPSEGPLSAPSSWKLMENIAVTMERKARESRQCPCRTQPARPRQVIFSIDGFSNRPSDRGSLPGRYLYFR